MPIIKLTEPVTIGESTITEIDIREPKGRDYRQLKPTGDPTPFGMAFDFASMLSGQPKKVFDELCHQDVLEVQDVMGKYLGKSQPTGPTSSEI